MGSVGFDGEVECQPSCKKYKLPTTLLVGCGAGAVNHASSVPRKLRSAIKKRAPCESITSSPLSISKKQCHLSSRVDDTLKNDSAKKSKPERGHMTKDEEEVAETLHSLATMFSSDTNKHNQKTGLNDEPTDTKSSSLLEEAGSSINAVQDTGIPTTQREESKKISSKATLDDVTCQYSPNLFDSKAQKIVKLQSSGGGGALQSKKSWKRSWGHVYISCLIKVLQISESKQGWSRPEKPTQLTTCGVSFNGMIDSAAAAEKESSAEIENYILFHKRLIQDHHRQQLLMSSSINNSSLPPKILLLHNQQQHFFPLGFQRNGGGAAFYYSDNK